MKNLTIEPDNSPGALARMSGKAPEKIHHYAVEMEWNGNTGAGTRHYSSYLRDYTITANGKAPILGSSDPAFRGTKTRYNPEEFLVAALSSCHMLYYLHLCATNGVTVVAYRDEASGSMAQQADGAGRFTEVTLRPVVRIAATSDRDVASSLHEEAHRLCFIANSVNFPVSVKAHIVSSEEDRLSLSDEDSN